MERSVKIASAQGLHARPAQLFTKAVKDSGATVTIGKPGGKQVNAASLLSVMGMGIKHDDEVILQSDNADVLGQLATMLESDLDA